MNAAVVINHNMEGEKDMQHTKILAVALALFTLLMTSVGAELESRAIRAVRSSGEHSSHNYGATLTETKEEAKIEIIRDRFTMFLIGGGSFGGAVVCVLLRRAWAKDVTERTRAMMATYFIVSLCSSVFCSPLMLKKYFSSEAEEAFAYSFLLAVASWVFWECAFAIGSRMKKAAEERGWGGIKGELLGGNNATVTSVPTKPTPVPNIPGADDKIL